MRSIVGLVLSVTGDTSHNTIHGKYLEVVYISYLKV